MDGPSVHVDTSDVARVLKGFTKRAENIDMDHLAQVMSTAVDDLIQSEGAAGEQGAWEPFRPETFYLHPHRIGGMLLQDTGVLAAFNARTTADTAEVYSPAAYAHFHVTGTIMMARRDPLAIHMGPVLDEMAEDILLEVTKG